MARFKLSYLAIVLFAGGTSSGLGAGCLFVTDFDPIGAGGSSTGTMTTGSAMETTTDASSTGAGGAGGAAPSCPPLTVEPFATFAFAGADDAIEGMVMVDGSAFVVGHASAGSEVSITTNGDTNELEGSFLVRLDPVSDILQTPLSSSIKKLSIVGMTDAVAVLIINEDAVSMETFTAGTLQAGIATTCTLENGVFTGGALASSANLAAALTFDPADAALTCEPNGSPFDLPLGSQFAVVSINLQGVSAFGGNIGPPPGEPSLAFREDYTSFDICFGGTVCTSYDGSPTSPQFGQQTAVLTPSAAGTIRAGGGTMMTNGADPIEISQLEVVDKLQNPFNVLDDSLIPAAPKGGVFGISSNRWNVTVSGFKSEPSGNHAMFLKVTASSNGGHWVARTYDDPKMSETESWGVAATTDESGDILTGAMMYRCPNDTAPARAAIFTAPFQGK